MQALDRLCGSFFELAWHFDPAAASAAGFVSEDARLGGFDAEAMRAHLAAFRATAAAVEELEIDDLPDEIDRTALLDHVRATVLRLEEDRSPVRDPGFWLSHLADALATLLLRPDDPAASGRRAQAAVERIGAIPDFLDAARGTLRRPPLALLDGALAALGPLGELLVHAAGAFGAAAPDGPEGLNQGVAAALQALARFGHWLRSEAEPEPDVKALALGTTRFDRRLHHRYAVRAGAAELGRYAEHLMAETEQALGEQSAALGLAGGWRDALAKPGADGASVAAVQAEIERARGFLRERGFPEVPARGPDAATLPPALEAFMPGATYLAASARLVVARAPRGRDVVAALVAAESLPGRHVQELAARGAGSDVRRRLRSAIAVEGWALYAETLMEELGFYATPEARLVRLVRLLEAAARLAADVGLHTAGMAPGAAVALLTGRAALDRGQAEAEVRRIVARPTDASAAALGRREILALRSAAGVRADDVAALARFHRGLLAFGALPPSLAAWGMGIAG